MTGDAETGGPLTGGPVAVVTGAASGIGRAVVEQVLGEGGRVVAVDPSTEGFEWLVGAHDRERYAVVVGDITEKDVNENAASTAIERFGGLDAAILNAARATALDLAADAIRVNAVCPGPTETGMTTRHTSDRERRAERSRHIPMQRWARAEEVAAVICFLASPAASFVTGTAIPVDGGIMASTGQFLPRPAD